MSRRWGGCWPGNGKTSRACRGKGPSKSTRDQTNPRQLRREIQAGLERLFALPQATPSRTEDVHQTLPPQTPAEIGPDNPMRFAFNRTTMRAA